MTTTGQHHVVVDPETSPVRATLIVATMCLAVMVIVGGVASLNVAIPTIGQGDLGP